MKNNILAVMLVMCTTNLVHGDDEALPTKLESLQSSWKSAKERALSPLKVKYVRALRKLRSDYMKADRLLDANAVQKEIDNIVGVSKLSQDDKTNQQTVQDILTSSTFIWSDGSSILFNKDGTITSIHSSWLGPYEVREDGVVVVTNKSYNMKYLFKFDKGNRVAEHFYEPGASDEGKTLRLKHKTRRSN